MEWGIKAFCETPPIIVSPIRILSQFLSLMTFVLVLT